MSINQEDDFFVVVWMVTYNHKNYIGQAIESILNQQCEFSFKLYISDDCSTDKTTEICQEYKNKYPDKIKLYSHQNNRGATTNGIFLYNECFNSKAKYIALCEGDDYWTDNLKLQKQVLFLESNPAFFATISPSTILDKDGNFINYTNQNLPKEIEYSHLIGSRQFHTNSILFRNRKFEFPTEIYSGDRVLMFWMRANGKISFIPDVMSAYRITGSGASSTLNEKNILLDFNIIKWIKEIDSSFLEQDFKVYLYKSLFYIARDKKSWNQIKYFVLLVYSALMSKEYKLKDIYYFLKY